MSSKIEPKVSIIIPVYNVEHYIGECLDSIYEQSYSNIEVILVDDCGSDNSMTVAGPYVERLRTRFDVRIVTEPCNGGPARARNSGLDVACGDYIFFLDSDDMITPTAIELLVSQTVIVADVDLVFGRVSLLGTGKPFPFIDVDLVFTNADLMSHYFARQVNSAPWNVLIASRHFNAGGLRFPDGMNQEDEFITFCLMLASHKVITLPNQTYIYRVRQTDSIMATFKRKNLDDDIAVYQMKLDLLKGDKFPKGQEKQAYNYFVGMVYLFAFRLVSGFIRGVDRSEFGRYFSIFRDLISQVSIFAGNGISFKARIIRFIFSLNYGLGYFFIRIHTLVVKK